MESVPLFAVPEHLAQRFAHHPPQTDERIRLHGLVREAAAQFATLLETILPPSREGSLAQTAVQEASMWANTALALHEDRITTPEQPSS